MAKDKSKAGAIGPTASKGRKPAKPSPSGSAANLALPEDKLVRIARVVHEATRAWQAANGQDAAPAWTRAPQWMKTSTREAILWRLGNPKAGASAQHDQWMEQKLADGWTWGKVKNGTAKTHPLMVPYEELPEVERRKDALVAAVINALLEDMH